MTKTIAKRTAALALALSLTAAPAVAFAATDTTSANQLDASSTQLIAGSANTQETVSGKEAEKQLQAEKEQRAKSQQELKELLDEQEVEAGTTARSQKQPTDKVLSYDKADIKAIGTQEQTGHTICCPSFSCAYADAVLDGTVHDHSYYTCSCCTWTDWGGGGSVDRCVGTSEELLREAYDQITAGKPTVIHVAGATGEHWICLIGYQNAKDPDHLTLDNFIALDPWDGAKITVSERWSLYGDGCEHISSR